MAQHCKIWLLAFLLILCLNSFSKNANDTIILKIRYKCYHIYDTTLQNTPTNENMILYIGKNYSLYTSWDKIYNDSLLADGMSKGKDMLNYQTNGMRKATKIQMLKNYSKPNLIYQHINMVRNYLILDNIEDLQQWNVTTETKKIENFTATKATCTFRGRFYEAWFSTDIPIPNGPYKFGGLPGLILEVNDIKNQIKYTFLGLENVAYKNLEMPIPPVKTSLTTLSEFKKIEEAKRNDPITWINTALEEMGSGNRIGEINGQTNNVKQPNKVNNPIELNFDTKVK